VSADFAVTARRLQYVIPTGHRRRPLGRPRIGVPSGLTQGGAAGRDAARQARARAVDRDEGQGSCDGPDWSDRHGTSSNSRARFPAKFRIPRFLAIADNQEDAEHLEGVPTAASEPTNDRRDLENGGRLIAS
jgi:hypothetical protein